MAREATPSLSGDILGEWREETIFSQDDNAALRMCRCLRLGVCQAQGPAAVKELSARNRSLLSCWSTQSS